MKMSNTKSTNTNSNSKYYGTVMAKAERASVFACERYWVPIPTLGPNRCFVYVTLSVIEYVDQLLFFV